MHAQRSSARRILRRSNQRMLADLTTLAATQAHCTPPSRRSCGVQALAGSWASRREGLGGLMAVQADGAGF